MAKTQCCARIYIHKSSTGTFESRCCSFKGKSVVAGKAVCGIHEKRYASGRKWFGFTDSPVGALSRISDKDTDKWMYEGVSRHAADDILLD